MMFSDLAHTYHFTSEDRLPLVIEPAVEGLDLLAFCDARRQEIARELSRHGAILFRNFGKRAVSEFERLIKTLTGHDLLEYRERSSPRRLVQGKVYTSTDYPSDRSIFLHNENSYQSNWPMKIFFFCVTPAAEGGQTPIADTRRVLGRLPSEIRERFAEKKVLYVRNFGSGLGLAWPVVFQTSDPSAVDRYCEWAGYETIWEPEGRLKTRRVGQAIAKHPKTDEMVWFNHAAFFHISSLERDLREALLQDFDQQDLPTNTFYGDGSAIEPETLKAIREAYRLETVKFDWQSGDILMLDNMLAAHGREPFVGQRKVLVGMSEPFKSSAEV